MEETKLTIKKPDLETAVPINGFNGELLLVLHPETMETWVWSARTGRILKNRRSLKRTDNFRTIVHCAGKGPVEIDHNLVLADDSYDPTNPKPKVVVPDNVKRLRDFSHYAFDKYGTCYQVVGHGCGIGQAVPRIVEEVKSGTDPLGSRRKLHKLRSNLGEYFHVDPKLVTEFLFGEESEYPEPKFHRGNFKPIYGRGRKHNPDTYLFKEEGA